MIRCLRQILCLWLVVTTVAIAGEPAVLAVEVERVTTAVPFPRGLAMVDGTLYVLCRGRVREAGGVSAAIRDQAGTLYAVDPRVAEPATNQTVSAAVRANGVVFAQPTDPPFRSWDRSASPPESDHRTDRPYCTLRYHEPSRNFFICAFSGIDMPAKPGQSSFSKNQSDALLRYDLRTKRWYEVERRGWLYGPDNCLAVGDWLYAVSKDNSRLVRYDLRSLASNPEAKVPVGELVTEHEYEGHSALAYRDGWLYVAYRTSSVMARYRLDSTHQPEQPLRMELLARFDPFDPVTRNSANLTDMSFDTEGRLYVVSAKPSRIYRFVPNPDAVFDAREGRSMPWVDLARATGNPQMKSENVLYHDGWIYVTSGDAYDYQRGADGAIYRVRVKDGEGTGTP
jgi:hypothetical protein